MICPKCGAEDIRLSRRVTWMDRLRRALGRHAWRCRVCRERFLAKLGDRSELRKPAARPGRKSRRHGKNGRLTNRTRRLVLEALLYAMLLAIFLVFLKYIVREPQGGSPSD
jgi:hypothetical protein